jgi:hypothetical protein
MIGGLGILWRDVVVTSCKMLIAFFYVAAT